MSINDLLFKRIAVPVLKLLGFDTSRVENVGNSWYINIRDNLNWIADLKFPTGPSICLTMMLYDGYSIIDAFEVKYNLDYNENPINLEIINLDPASLSKI